MKPKLRFKGYDEEWQKVRVDELGEWIKGQALSKDMISNNGTHKCLHYGKLFSEEEIIYKIESFTDIQPIITSQGNEILIPDSDVTPTGLGRCTHIPFKNVILGSGINILRVKDTFNPHFCALNLSFNKNQIIKEVKGTTVMHVHACNLSKIKLLTPNLYSEQTIIGEYFKQLDSAINKSESEITKLKQIKKASLQSMFPQPGERKPKLRFKEFNDDWNEVKLNSICSKKNSNYSENSLSKNLGNFPIFGATGYIQNIATYDLSTPYIGIVKDGSGAGRCNIYPSYSSILGTMQYILPNENTNIAFLSNIINSIDFSIFTIGSSIPHIYFRDYGELRVFVPSFEEQEKIGSFFSNLDSQISLLSKKLEKLKQVKKACLSQMFV